MADAGRFAGLKKISDKTAGELISGSRMPFRTMIESPRDSDVATVLAELDGKGATVDLLALFALALPPREAVWWACLAARDLYPKDGERRSPTLEAAEAWVFKPTDESREVVQKALDKAKPADEATECATAALFAKGTMGTGDLDQHDAPPDVRELCVFGMIARSLVHEPSANPRKAEILVERALDIARGGNGRVELEAPEPAPA